MLFNIPLIVIIVDVVVHLCFIHKNSPFSLFGFSIGYLLVFDAYLEAVMQASQAFSFAPFNFVSMHNCNCNLAESQSQVKNRKEMSVELRFRSDPCDPCVCDPKKKERSKSKEPSGDVI